MSLGVLNNIAAIYAQNNLNQTQSSLQDTLNELSSGSRINSPDLTTRPALPWRTVFMPTRLR